MSALALNRSWQFHRVYWKRPELINLASTRGASCVKMEFCCILSAGQLCRFTRALARRRTRERVAAAEKNKGKPVDLRVPRKQKKKAGAGLP